VRVGVIFPTIIHMQVRAILEAACNVTARGDVAIPYIMIPLISHVNELKEIQRELEKVVKGMIRIYDAVLTVLSA